MDGRKGQLWRGEQENKTGLIPSHRHLLEWTISGKCPDESWRSKKLNQPPHTPQNATPRLKTTTSGACLHLQIPGSSTLLKPCTRSCVPIKSKRKGRESFLSGSVVKNLPASARDRGSIPDLGRSTCHRATKPMHNYWACVLSAGSRTYGPHALQLLKTVCPKAWALQQAEPLR